MERLSMNLMREINLDDQKAVHIQPGGENELFYSNNSQEFRCIGHLRFDVDSCGKLWSMWNPHRAAQKYNRQPFKDEFDSLVNALRVRLYAKPHRVTATLAEMGIPCIEQDRRYYGFHVDTDDYSYYVRIFPYAGDYSYIYCYARHEEAVE